MQCLLLTQSGHWQPEFAVMHKPHIQRCGISEEMIWRFSSISRRDLIALVLCAAVAVMILLFAARFPNSANWGFGPDWNCENVPQGEAVCIKRPSGGNSGDTSRNGR